MVAHQTLAAIAATILVLIAGGGYLALRDGGNNADAPSPSPAPPIPPADPLPFQNMGKSFSFKKKGGANCRIDFERGTGGCNVQGVDQTITIDDSEMVFRTITKAKKGKETCSEERVPLPRIDPTAAVDATGNADAASTSSGRDDDEIGIRLIKNTKKFKAWEFDIPEVLRGDGGARVETFQYFEKNGSPLRIEAVEVYENGKKNKVILDLSTSQKSPKNPNWGTYFHKSGDVCTTKPTVDSSGRLLSNTELGSTNTSMSVYDGDINNRKLVADPFSISGILGVGGMIAAGGLVLSIFALGMVVGGIVFTNRNGCCRRRLRRRLLAPNSLRGGAHGGPYEQYEYEYVGSAAVLRQLAPSLSAAALAGIASAGVGVGSIAS